MGEPSKAKRSFCESTTFCCCPSDLKKAFFSDYKRFGIHVFVESGLVKIESTRFASKEPPCIYIPLEKLAEIFATENVWQLINSAISCQKKLKHGKDLVRVFSLKKMGTKGGYLLQLTVPKTGGLNLAVLSQVGDETRGLPTTVIHMLPVEVILFVDMLPYYLLNRGDGRHTFWTSLAAILNLKFWIEDSLESKNVEFLAFVLNCLHRESLKELLADVATFPDQKHVNFDAAGLRHKKFAVHSEKVDVGHFCMVLCNLIFRLRYKVVDWEGRDDFTSHAKVLPREPPKPIFCYSTNTFTAEYTNDQEAEEEETEEEKKKKKKKEAVVVVDSEVDFFESSQPVNETATSKTKEVKRKLFDKEKECSPEKKGKLTEEEWNEVLIAAELIHNDPDDMEPSEDEGIRPGQSPPICQETGGEKEPDECVTFDTLRPIELTNVEELSLTHGKANQNSVCLHFHFGESRMMNIISYESKEKTFKMNIESRPIEN